MWLIHFLDHFVPPGVATSANEWRQARLLVGIVVYGAIVISFSVLVRSLTEGWTDALAAVILADLFILAILGVFWITRSQSFSADCIVIYIFFAVASIAWNDGGLHSRVMTWLAVLPIAANFLGGRIKAIASLGFVGVGLATLLLAHHFKWLQPGEAQDSLPGRAFAFFASTALVTILAALYEQTRRQIERDQQRLHAVQKQWVSIVNHELKTPLTSTHSALSLLTHSYHAELSPPVKSILAIAQRNSARLVRLVDDLNDVDRLNWQKLHLRYESCDVVNLARECAEVFLESARERSIHIELVHDPIVVLELDPDRIAQVLQNLIENALNHSGANTEIIVEIRQSKSEVSIRVADQGSGIPEEFLSEMFKPFSQADMNDSRKMEGSGLGLYICRSIIELHGGSISASNRSTGGAEFRLTLPKRAIVN